MPPPTKQAAPVSAMQFLKLEQTGVQVSKSSIATPPPRSLADVTITTSFMVLTTNASLELRNESQDEI